MPRCWCCSWHGLSVFSCQPDQDVAHASAHFERIAVQLVTFLCLVGFISSRKSALLGALLNNIRRLILARAVSHMEILTFSPQSLVFNDFTVPCP